MTTEKLLSLEEILRLHFQVVNDYGGSHGVRDEGRLHSLAAEPAQVAFGQAQYPSLHEKAAVYLRNIVADPPFVGGNKRTAVTVAAIFLMRNGYQLTAKPKELEDFAVRSATERLDVPAVAAWLRSHTRHR